MSRLLLLLIICSSHGAANGFQERLHFLDDFLNRQFRPAALISFMNLPTCEIVESCKFFARRYKVFTSRSRISFIDNSPLTSNDNVVFLADFQAKDILDVLFEAHKLKQVIQPARWILFYKLESNGRLGDIILDKDEGIDYQQEKIQVENITAKLYIPINSEVYIAMEGNDQTSVFLIHKRSPAMPLIWEKIGTWHKSFGLDRLLPGDSIAIRRRNLEGLNVTAATVILRNESLGHMTDYLYRHVDTTSKLIFYMTRHLFEWMNATGRINVTSTWGYQQPDGTFQGVIRELNDLRADFSGSVLIPMKSRSYAVEFTMEAAPMGLTFVFRKPSLASVANIYRLPFSKGVWLSVGVLILISVIALFITSFREMALAKNSDTKFALRLSQSFHDILCLVFQQGTAVDPISASSRQILLLGLLAFMFLYTAYSANVVALLQSPTNDINSVEALLNSPMQCGGQDVPYMREIFQKEARPIHRQLWLKKGLPQGERFFMSVEDGVRRMREGMFAFQVEPTACFDAIKSTFLEHEKCNLGTVKYTDFLYPVVGLARRSHIKEALKIGVYRILEAGVQSRSTRRITSATPSCNAGAASFAAVTLSDVASAFHWMFALYGVAIVILAGEVYLSKRDTALGEWNERSALEDFGRTNSPIG